MTARGDAVWRQGQWRVTVTSPEGGEWVYDVIGPGDRPSDGWFAGTPWAIYPGAEWEEQPHLDGEGKPVPVTWTVPVFLERPEVIQDLTSGTGLATS